jgi:hypothetical protein
MNSKQLAQELESIARELLLADDDAWLDTEDVEAFCPACADKMRGRRMSRVKASVVKDSLRKAQWERLPRGWTRKSLEKYWATLTGKVEHKVSKCIRELTNKVTDPGAFCASLADAVEGKGWRRRR